VADKKRFVFILDAFTPDTLPMARLAEYLTDLANLLGEKERVHFKAVEEGSAGLAYDVEAVAVPKEKERARGARIASAVSEERRAFESIDHRLRKDNSPATLKEQDTGATILFFPGPTRQVDPEYGPFNEQGSLQGRIISVGGKRNIVNVNIQDGENIHYCEATRDVALQLAPLMFHHDVRLLGTGRYFRNADGKWEMMGFRISQFARLDSKPLVEVVDRLRAVTRKVGLPKDIIARLRDLREA
jgi:hypothetical protein